MSKTVKKSTISAVPTKTQTIDRATHDLEAATAMIGALKSYIIAAGEADSKFVDMNNFTCSMETLLGVAAETVDRARESVKALVAVPLGAVVPMQEGGAA